MHNITSDYLTPVMRLDFEVLEKYCGDAVIDHGMVTIVSTKWHRVSPDEASAREDEMTKGLWSDFVRRGCQVHRIANAEDAGTVVKGILQGYPRLGDDIPLLRVQHELCELKLPVSETEVLRTLQLPSERGTQSKKGKAKTGRTSSSVRKLLSSFLGKDDSQEGHRRGVLKKQGPRGVAGMSRSRSLGPSVGGKRSPRVKSEAFQFLIPNQTTTLPRSQGDDNQDPNANEVDDAELMRMYLRADALLSQPAPLLADPSQGNDEQPMVGPNHCVADGGLGLEKNHIDKRENGHEVVLVEDGEVDRDAILRSSSGAAPAPVGSEGESEALRLAPSSTHSEAVKPRQAERTAKQDAVIVSDVFVAADGVSCSGTFEEEFVSCKSSIENSFCEGGASIINTEERQERAAYEIGVGASLDNETGREPRPEAARKYAVGCVKDDKVRAPTFGPPSVTIPGAFEGQCISPDQSEGRAETEFIQQSQVDRRARGWSRFNLLSYF